MEIVPAAPEDLDAIRALLRAARLPDQDIGAHHLSDFLVARDDTHVAGVVGLERFGDVGLLRSLAVSPDHRGKGLGDELTKSIVARAVETGLSELVLLTTTAKEYFARRGFAVIERDAVPERVKASAEFTSLCPSTATSMRKQLSNSGRRRVLFVCVENSNRSQMAEAFARELGGDLVDAVSAGSRPSGHVNPRALQMMAESGISLAAHCSKSLDDVGSEPFDAIVTMGCGDACPLIPARRRIDWALADPKHLSDDDFRAVRDDIRRRVIELLAEMRS